MTDHIIYETLIIVTVLFAVASIVCIALARGPADTKRVNELMNEAEALRVALRISDARASAHGLALIGIRNAFAGQKSGTAQKATRLAKQGLEA